uniref:Uncharacterized protein n=1 Tax=Rhizophora mucronata TaxID=61149 RepID=A0A2P2PDA1_RHIMU
MYYNCGKTSNKDPFVFGLMYKENIDNTCTHFLLWGFLLGAAINVKFQLIAFIQHSLYIGTKDKTEKRQIISKAKQRQTQKYLFAK